MIRLARFLKPFLAGLGLVVVLLLIQAICELNLPNYMSRIVNVGIQQAGVEDSTPRALSQEGYKFITDFMSDDERSRVQDSYELVAGEGKDARGKPISETWPRAASEQIYVLKQEISSDELQKLDASFGNATWTMLNLVRREQSAQQETSAANAAGTTGTTDAAQQGAASLQGLDLQNTELSQLYELHPKLAALPPDWHSEAREQALAMDASLRGQSGILLVAGFYRELGADMGAIEMSYILRIGLIMLLVTVISGVATVLVSYFSSRIGAGVARDVRHAIFEKVTGFSHAELDHFSTASLITRTTNDVSVIQTVLSIGIRMVCYAPIMGIGGVFMALSKSSSMSWIIGVAVAVLIGIMLTLFVVVIPKFKRMQPLIDRLNLVARESLNGLAVVRAFSRTDFEAERFDVVNKELSQVNLFVVRAITFLMPVMMLFMNGLTVLIIWVGSEQVAASQMQVGDMMAYMQYVMQIIMSFMFVAMLFIFFPRAAVSANRISEILKVEPTIVDPPEPRHIDSALRGRIEFRDVSFRYAGADTDALSHISFVAHPGQTTAFIGSTGSGKSSIMNLILRFYDVTDGAVLVGGVDVRELAQAELREEIGYVPQHSALMAGTIESNIGYGLDSLSEHKREAVARVAQALDFVDEHEERFGFGIAQGGSNISGGQRQRLSIARALAKDPIIYLFDDSFSALDFTTDAALRTALAEYARDKTAIIVAQRVSTIMDADQILVIDEGRIVGTGTHQELLTSCKAYLEIASSQLSAADLLRRGSGSATNGPATGEPGGGEPRE
ncbi:MAG: ABC transporter ATP-binding protein/permease [Coriobacteriales bacterium]|jgi:ATP-binding cassette subfamily B protein|nr:ABC transporter ATP-binding protein/permease [Coriobacteriales bacterium]